MKKAETGPYRAEQDEGGDWRILSRDGEVIAYVPNAFSHLTETPELAEQAAAQTEATAKLLAQSWAMFTAMYSIARNVPMHSVTWTLCREACQSIDFEIGLVQAKGAS